MESASLARHYVAADVSEFAQGELEAFVAARRRQRPSAWSRVEQLQEACRRESPEALARLHRAEWVLAEQTPA